MILIKELLTLAALSSRPPNLWRYSVKLARCGRIYSIIPAVLSICWSASLQIWGWHKGHPRLQKMSKHNPSPVMTSGSNPELNIIRKDDNDTAPTTKGLLEHTWTLKAHSGFKPKACGHNLAWLHNNFGGFAWHLPWPTSTTSQCICLLSSTPCLSPWWPPKNSIWFNPWLLQWLSTS